MSDAAAVQALAIRSGDRVRTHAEAQERAARIAAALREYGVSPGDRVTTMLRNDIAFIETHVGAGLAGAIPVPGNWHWRGDDLRHLLTDSGSKVAFVHSDLLGAVEAVAPDGMRVVEVEVPPEIAAAYGLTAERAAPSKRYPTLEEVIAGHPPIAEPAESQLIGMIYTSGTTGSPKGILRERSTAEKTLEMAGIILTHFGLAPGMRTLIPAPLYHSAPYGHWSVAIAGGCDLTIMPRFDPEELLRTVEANRIEHMQVVPTMFVRLLKLPEEVRKRYDISSLRSVVHAAAPCPPDVKSAMIDWWGPIILEYYGGTETGVVTACDSTQWLAHPGTVGTAIPGADVRILGADDAPLGTGEVGEIYLKPPSSWPDFTYLGADQKRRDMERDGYLSVGDMGYLDEDGFLFLTDRRNHMVISGGVNLYPAEIENCLIGMDGVRDVAIFGIPDEEFGEVLACHLVADAGITEDAVREYVRSHLAGYKVPKVVVFEEELPREDSGKLFKRKLREPYWREAGRSI
ncbi:MAG: AMP-binding protein [Streptosporangiales bacterium]|nr:AMP-binding protein [Streptosporangiales bacterium]